MSLLLWILIALINTKLSYTSNDLISLELDRPDGRYFKVQESRIDNIFYKHFKASYRNFVVRVNNFTDKIWDSTGYARCVYALVAHSNEEPYLLYLQIDSGFSTKHEYFKKLDKQWKSIDIDEYCNSLVQLRNAVQNVKVFDLDIWNAVNNQNLNILYTSGDKPYTFFSVKPGYFASSVSFIEERLWSAKEYGDRCVAAWAYINNGVYYILRILVTNKNNRSELQTFYFLSGKWTHIHTLYENDKGLYVKKPEDFPYPDYTFNQKRIDSSIFTEDTDLPPDDFQESYFDLTGDYYKFKIQDHDVYTDEDKIYGLTTEPVGGEVDKSDESYYDLSGDYYSYKVQDDDFSHIKPDTSSIYEPMVLDISNFQSRLFSDFRQVDNVSYRTYKRLVHAPINKVVDKSVVIWEAASTYESCEYAMAPQTAKGTLALFLLISVNGEPRRAFFRKKNEEWEKSSLEGYKTTLKYLKSFVTDTYLTLNLAKKEEWLSNTIEVKLETEPGLLLLPKSGFSCHSVVYNETPVWQSEDPFDKCVAAWVYENQGIPYLTRLLLKYADGTSDLVSYLNVSNLWVVSTSYKYSHMNKSRFKKPENFHNPEYEFNQDLLDYEFASPIQSDTPTKRTFSIVTLEEKHSYVGDYSALEKKEGPSGEISLEEIVDIPKVLVLPRTSYVPDCKAIVREDCITLNLKKTIKAYHKLLKALFDKKLMVLSYQAPQGKYFDLIYDGKIPIFLGHHLTHVCIAVNIYTKEKVLYLADMLVRVKDEDVTLYMFKQDKRWAYIDKDEFDKLLYSLTNPTTDVSESQE